MIALVIAILIAGFKVNGFIITAFISLLSVAATYEILHHIVKTGNVFRKALACVYAMAAFFSVSDILNGAGNAPTESRFLILVACLLLFSMVYVLLFTLSLIREKGEFDVKEVFALLGVPFMYSAAFAALNCIITGPRGIYYLLLAVNFSSICDTGAYFTGVAFGKHKLCEHVSPKKTVEGAIGGIVASLIGAVILSLSFKTGTNIFVLLGITVVMCIVGMLGDLFASIIKRSVGVKDYSNLIPGHGGILDRVDSMLFIAPALLSVILLGVV